MSESGISVKSELFKEGDFEISHGEKSMQDLLNSKEAFTAVVCASDYIAYGVYKLLFEKNYKIPDDYSVVGYNDLDRTLEEITAGKEVSIDVTNPIGCNVKWDGKNAHWMSPKACDLVR